MKLRHCLAAILLAAASVALGQAPTMQDLGTQAQNNARAKAVKALIDDIYAIKISDSKTLKDFLADTDVKADYHKLVLGVVEDQPAAFNGDGTCIVKVALPGLKLKANLQIIKSESKMQTGEFSSLTFDFIADKPFEAEGVSPVSMPQGSRTVASCVEGWQKVSARKRIAVENAARTEALKKLASDAGKTPIAESKTLESFVAANPPAKEAYDNFMKKLLPESKCYYPGGIVEVRFSLAFAKLWDAIDSAVASPANTEHKVEQGQLAAAKERAAKIRLESSAAVQLDGKPATITRTQVPVDLTMVSGSRSEPGK